MDTLLESLSSVTLQPFSSNEIPDELAGLELANQAARTITGENKYVLFSRC